MVKILWLASQFMHKQSTLQRRYQGLEERGNYFGLVNDHEDQHNPNAQSNKGMPITNDQVDFLPHALYTNTPLISSRWLICIQ